MFPKKDVSSVFCRWEYRSIGEICFFSICIQAIVCVVFMWCFPQFSALYPEMVDAVILLDSLGFLPTNPVITIFLWSIFYRNKKLQLLFSLCLSLSSFLCVFPQENTPKVLREGIDEILQYEKNTAKTERIYTYEKAVERYYTPTLVKLTISSAAYFEFVQRWPQSQRRSLCTTTGKCLSAPEGANIKDILHQPPAISLI